MVEQWLVDLMKKYFIVSWCENDGGLYPGCPIGGVRVRRIPGVGGSISCFEIAIQYVNIA